MIPEILDRLHAFLATRCANGRLRAASLAIRRNGVLVDRWVTGRRASGADAADVRLDTRFLVASLTKPVTAAATMRLVEEGELALSTPVADVLPAFGGGGREAIQVWHLMTHTSGLPDMVPENTQLRSRHAGLPEFFEHVCRVPLLFRPGSGISYQSTGSLVMAMLVERLSSVPFRTFVAREILGPAGMRDAHVGLPDTDDGSADAEIELPPGQHDTDWHWNSRYWRTLGTPWGGLAATATDLAAFLQVFLDRGLAAGGRRVLAASTVATMVRDWTSRLAPEFPACGLAWRLRGDRPPAPIDPEGGAAAPHDPAGVAAPPYAMHHRTYLGDLTSTGTFGHGGASGCAMWADPASGVAAVILTSTPASLVNGTLTSVANLIASAVEA